MKIEAKTVEDYWRQVPDDWRRERMEALRAMIFEVAPDAEETIGWGMLRYGFGGDRIICHMNAQVRYVGLYIGRLERLDADGAVRAAFDCGKTCVRVKRSSDISLVRGILETEAGQIRERLL
jgi:uncharacterized protein YdhG (YjbR/CyaY superfamily)